MRKKLIENKNKITCDQINNSVICSKKKKKKNFIALCLTLQRSFRRNKRNN